VIDGSILTKRKTTVAGRPVADLAEVFGPGGKSARGLLLLVALASACLIVVVWTTSPLIQIAATLTGLTLIALVFLERGYNGLKRMDYRRLDRRLVQMTGLDAAPSFTTDDRGQIQFQNAAASARFGGVEGNTLVAVLQEAFASPSAVLYRLQARAAHAGAAREDVVSRNGHTRLAVHRLSDERFLWRLEEFVDRSGLGRGAENISLPMLTANKAGVVLFSNEAAGPGLCQRHVAFWRGSGGQQRGWPDGRNPCRGRRSGRKA
jgi:two-component system, cell cycle sensor histidine kinase and response regulator CckA